MIHAVAIKYEGTIYTLPQPARHYELVDIIIADKKVYSFDKGIKGFLTDDGTFLARDKAAVHAVSSGQLTKLPVGGDLYSEMVW